MQVDSQFGTNEDLHRLIDQAHAKGIRIVLDAVFNHCSEELSQFQDVLKRGKESPYYDWFVIYGDKPDPQAGNYEMFASCTYMPKFNTSNPEVQKYLCDIGCHYVEKYGIDGWRLDVSDEVSHDLWRAFRKAVKGCNAECIIIGENWHDASNYLRGDQYDSIMNYAFTKACLDYFAAGAANAEQTAWKLNDILARNTDTVNSMMLNLLDSHDTHRFSQRWGWIVKRWLQHFTCCFFFRECLVFSMEQSFTWRAVMILTAVDVWTGADMRRAGMTSRFSLFRSWRHSAGNMGWRMRRRSSRHRVKY